MITVVKFNSLSFTGTTWINALLGAHEKSIAVGPPDRVLNVLLEDRDNELCRIHKKDCDFWNGFKGIFNKDENFYLQLAKYSNKDFIIINNPIIGGIADKQLQDSNIIVKEINIVRDGRAICASYIRQYPENDTIDVIKEWFLPSAKQFYFSPYDQDILCIRYEDILDDTLNALDTIGKFINLTYTEKSLNFWDYDQHLTAGNAGVFNTIRYFENPEAISFKDAKFIKEQVALMKANPAKAFKQARWKDELSIRELFIFDFFAGDINKRWGYSRDRFDTSQYINFTDELNLTNNSIGQNLEIDQIYTSVTNELPCIDRMKQCIKKALKKIFGK